MSGPMILSDDVGIFMSGPGGGSGGFQAPPTNVVLTPGVNEVTPAWTAAAGASSYNARYSTDNATWTSVPNAVSGTPITGLSGGTNYYVQVQAVGSVNSSWAVPTPLISYAIRSDAVVYYPMNSGVTSVLGSQFNAALSQYYSAPEVSAIQVGGTSFTAFGFFNAATVGIEQGIVGQFFSASGVSWLVYIDMNNSNKLSFLVDDGAGNATAIAGPTISANTTYYFEAWQDIVAGTINLAINRGTPVTPVAVTHFAQSSTDPFTIGQWGGSGAANNFMNGGIGPVGLVLRTLTTPESTGAYNSGNGSTFANLPSTLKASLVFYSTCWPIGQNYNPVDDTGNLTLTNNGFIGPGGGVVPSTGLAQNQGITQIVDIINGDNLVFVAPNAQPVYNQQFNAGVGYWEAFSDAVHYLQTPQAYLTAGHVAALAFDRTNPFTATAIIRLDETTIDSIWVSQRIGQMPFTGWGFQYDHSTGKILFLIADTGGGVSYLRGSTVLSAHQPYVVSIVFTGSGGDCTAGMSIWINGVQETTTIVATGVNASIVSSTAQFAILASGNDGTNAVPGSASKVTVNSSALNSTQIGNLHTYLMDICGLNTLPSTAPQILIIGDSIAYGSGVSSQQNALYNLLQALVPAGWLVRSIAIPGSTAAQWVTNYAAQVAPFYSGSRSANILFIHVLSNDINTGTTTAAAAYASLTSLVTDGQGTGFKVLVNTVITRAGSPGTIANWTSQWGPLNTLIVANTAGADAVADCRSVLNDNTSRAQYNQDMIHPSDAGAILQAGVEFTALQTIGV